MEIFRRTKREPTPDYSGQDMQEGDNAEQLKQSIFDLAEDGFVEGDEQVDKSGSELKELLKDKPELITTLEELMDESLTDEQFFETIKTLNEEYGLQEEREGTYKTVFFNLPSGHKFRIKVFQVIENALSFSGDSNK